MTAEQEPPAWAERQPSPEQPVSVTGDHPPDDQGWVLHEGSFFEASSAADPATGGEDVGSFEGGQPTQADEGGQPQTAGVQEGQACQSGATSGTVEEVSEEE